MKAFLSSLAVTLLLCACSTSDVIPFGPNTYTVSSSGAGFGTGSVRAHVIGAANDFCSKRGLVMVPVSLKTRQGIYGQQPPSADLVFRALKPGDPDLKKPNGGGQDITIHVQD